MAEPKATINIEKVNFRFDISDISKINDPVWSPEVLVNGIPWRVYAFKNVSSAEPSLGLFLYCAKSEATANWSCAATAKFELLSSKNDCNTKKLETGGFVFNQLEKRFGFNDFIRWSDLFAAENGYVKDDAINLKIEIKAESSKINLTFESIIKSSEEGCTFEFRVKVSHIESLLAVETPDFLLLKIPCYLLVFKHSSNLGIALMTRLRDSVSPDAKISIEVTGDLVSTNGTSKRIETAQKTIDRKEKDLRIEKIISQDELFEPRNGFINDGTITIELKIKTKLLQGGTAENASKRRTMTDHQRTAAKHLKLKCKICNKAIIDQDISSLPCGHMFCSRCITKSIRAQKVCPSCDVRTTLNGLRRILLPKSG